MTIPYQINKGCVRDGQKAGERGGWGVRGSTARSPERGLVSKNFLGSFLMTKYLGD